MASTSLSDKKIMLIDDDDVVRMLLKRVLTTAGCSVESCAGVKDALTTLVQSRPNLIILDLNMPERDGYDFLKIRQKTKALSAIPVIVLSGTKSAVDVQRALEYGADQFIEKPFESWVVIQKIKYIFYKAESSFYTFPPTEAPNVLAEIQSEIVESAPGQLKVDSQVRFRAGKPINLYSESFLKIDSKPLICRVENKFVEMQQGFFRAILSPTGFDTEEKKVFDNWQRSLLK